MNVIETLQTTEISVRLVDLNPQWVEINSDTYSGLMFDCPHCKTRRLTVSFDPPIGGAVIKIDLSELSRKKMWTRAGDTFETLTLAPSIVVSGHWHGFITKGDVTSSEALNGLPIHEVENERV